MTLQQLLQLGIEIIKDEREVMIFSFSAPGSTAITDPDARRCLRQYNLFLKHARLQLAALNRITKQQRKIRDLKELRASARKPPRGAS